MTLHGETGKGLTMKMIALFLLTLALTPCASAAEKTIGDVGANNIAALIGKYSSTPRPSVRARIVFLKNLINFRKRISIYDTKIRTNEMVQLEEDTQYKLYCARLTKIIEMMEQRESNEPGFAEDPISHVFHSSFTESGRRLMEAEKGIVKDCSELVGGNKTMIEGVANWIESYVIRFGENEVINQVDAVFSETSK